MSILMDFMHSYSINTKLCNCAYIILCRGIHVYCYADDPLIHAEETN